MAFFAADGKTKAVYNQLLSGAAWRDVWSGQFADLETNIESVAQWLDAQYPQHATTLHGFSQTNGAIAKLMAHLAAHSAQLAKNLSLAMSYYHELLSMGQPASIEATIQQLFGSVMGEAEQLLITAISQTQAIQAQVSPTAIEAAVNDLVATMLQASSLVDTEKQGIRDVIATLSMATDAYTFPSLYKNELCKPVMDVLFSDAMKTALDMSDDDEGAEHDDAPASPGTPDPPDPIVVAPNTPVIQQVPEYGAAEAGAPWRLNVKLASSYMTIPAFSESATAVAGSGGTSAPPPVIIQPLSDL
jgi:hypothetical protein